MTMVRLGNAHDGRKGRKFFGATAVARKLGVDRTTIIRWWQKGLMPFTRVAGVRRISDVAFERWREEHSALLEWPKAS